MQCRAWVISIFSSRNVDSIVRLSTPWHINPISKLFGHCLSHTVPAKWLDISLYVNDWRSCVQNHFKVHCIPGRHVCVCVTVATEATTITESPYVYDWGSAESFFSGWDLIGMLPSPHCFSMVCGATLHASCQTGHLFASFPFLIWFFKNWFILGLYNNSS